jgi:hypothetical protein
MLIRIIGSSPIFSTKADKKVKYFFCPLFLLVKPLLLLIHAEFTLLH